jgi:hypothetical protein
LVADDAQIGGAAPVPGHDEDDTGNDQADNEPQRNHESDPFFMT